MRFIIIEPGIVALAILITACDDPSGPDHPAFDDPTTVATLVRQRPTVPTSVPDSVGIPPSIPPIVEEAPAGFDGAP